MKISVIIPLSGEETALGRCVSSLDDQSYKDFEIIFVGDHENLPQGENIKHISFEEAEKTKIENLDSQWICMVNGDECVSPCYLENLLKLCTENDADASMCGVRFAEKDTPVDKIGIPLMLHHTEVMDGHHFVHASEDSDNPAYGADENKLLRKDLVEDTIADLIDYGTATFIAHNAEKVAINLEPLYFYSEIYTLEEDEDEE